MRADNVATASIVVPSDYVRDFVHIFSIFNRKRLSADYFVTATRFWELAVGEILAVSQADSLRCPAAAD